jgi:hypothetical protein
MQPMVMVVLLPVCTTSTWNGRRRMTSSMKLIGRPSLRAELGSNVILTSEARQSTAKCG